MCDASPGDDGSARAYWLYSVTAESLGAAFIFLACLVAWYEARLKAKRQQQDAEMHKMMIDVHGSPMPLADALESLLNSDPSPNDADVDYDRFGGLFATMTPSETASAIVVGAPREAVHGITAELLGLNTAPTSPDEP